jgi:hypothetical protein
VSRPLWWQAHAAGANPALGRAQERVGLAVDPTRSYDERTIIWLSWYIGWPALAVAAAGLVWMTASTVRRRDPQLLVLLTTVGTVGALYLNRASITPNQVWAMRRFLPVVLPGLLVAAVWAAARLVRRRPDLLWFGGLVAAGVALSPALFWGPVAATGEQTGEYDEVMSACHAIHGDKVVITGRLTSSGYYLPSTRVVCGAQTLYVPEPTATTLAQISKNWGGKPVSLLTFYPDSTPWTTAPTVPVHTGIYPSWQNSLVSRPPNVNRERRTLWAGDSQADGSVVPRSG